MFGYYALKDKIDDQNAAIEKLYLSSEYLNEYIQSLRDEIDDQNEAIRGFHLTIKCLEESLYRVCDRLQSLESGEHYKSFSTSRQYQQI